MIFTPLVSPAVTPLDTQFQYPDYAAPVDAFSPLTSPALRAQNQAAQHSVHGAVRGSDTSDTTSPIDPSLDLSAPATSSTAASLRKSKRKTSSSSTKNPVRAVRQSPAMKPQNRKKQPSSTVIPPKEISGIIEEARRSKQTINAQQAADGKLHFPYSQDSSGPDSVSPEPFPEVLMPPPATPKSGSASRSPYLNAKQNGHPAALLQDTDDEPATPASLMKIRKQARKHVDGMNRPTSSLKEQTALAEADMEQIMEDIVLPEPANTTRKPTLKPINTADANIDQSTPTMSARKTPKYGPASAPITANTSALPSPQLVSSPASGEAIKRVDSKLMSRDPKKRNSQSSVHVSPALRPKISPSIKPLLPEGGKVILFLIFHHMISAADAWPQPWFPQKPLPFYWPPNLITRTSSKAPTCPASPTLKIFPQISLPNARHTKLLSKAAATVSTPRSRRLQASCPPLHHKSMVNLAAWEERVPVS